MPPSIFHPRLLHKTRFISDEYIDISMYHCTMTHVSKQKMRPGTSVQIKKNFFSVVMAPRNRRILESLLTPTETLMLAKRLGILVMLEQSHSSYRIEKTLKVSISTVVRLDRARQAGVFNPIRKAFGQQDTLSFSEHLELILAAGMPSIAGPRHQKRLNELRGRKRRHQ